VANQTPEGAVIDDPNDPWMRALSGNLEGHTDSSYLPVSAKVSMLTAHAVPSRGGQTEWADMRAAYDDLDPAAQEQIASLAAYHSFAYAQSRRFPDGLSDSEHLAGAPLRPLVKTHPITWRKALFIGRHAFAVKGLEPDQSAHLLDQLLTGACRPPRVYPHDWRVGDLVMWDNRAVLHRARPWDITELRHLTHSRVAGDPATESAVAFG
jgi:alpha-ketoglutarate-dependent taurine dioxygenase